MTNSKNFDELERKILKFINNYKFNTLNKNFREVLLKIFEKYLKKIGIELNTSEVNMYIRNDLNLNTNQINECEQNIVKLLELLSWLLNEKLIIPLSNSKIENTFLVNMPTKFEKEEYHISNFEYKNDEILKLISSGYIANLNDLISKNFLSIDNYNLKLAKRNLKITSIILGATLLVYTVPIFYKTPIRRIKFINSDNVQVLKKPITKNEKIDVTSILSYGENIEIIKKLNDYYLISYDKNGKIAYGWVNSNQVEILPLWRTLNVFKY